LSGGAGYTYRAAGYSTEIPYFLRTDFKFLESPHFRAWLDFNGYRSLETDTTAVNVSRLNIIPGGSFLYRGVNAEQGFFGGGVAHVFSPGWEGVVGGQFTPFGNYAAKEVILNFGISFHSVQNAVKEYSQLPTPALVSTRKMEKRRPIFQYGFSTPVQKVSSRANYIRISVGTEGGVMAGDQFHIFAPASEHFASAIASAKVVASRTNTSFLHIEENFFRQRKVLEGDEARRVIPQE
jgi:hypothetical protein